MRSEEYTLSSRVVFRVMLAVLIFLASYGCGLDGDIDLQSHSTRVIEIEEVDQKSSRLGERDAEAEIFRFVPRSGKWVKGFASDLVDGELFFRDSCLWEYRNNTSPGLQLAEVTLAQLASAQATWHPGHNSRVPTADDVVFITGDNFAFSRLRDVKDGDRFAFQGQVYDARWDKEGLQVRATGQTVHRVKDTFASRSSRVFDLELFNESGSKSSQLTATGEHPFYLPEVGRFLELRKLQVGDELLSDDGSRRGVLSSEARQADVSVYNFEVEHAHTYFVYPRGDDRAVLVHNKASRRRTVDDLVESSDLSRLSRSDRRSVRSLYRRLNEHREKLDAYRSDPSSMDNQGFLQNAPSPEVRQQIIDGRINHLENEISNFEQQIRSILEE